MLIVFLVDNASRISVERNVAPSWITLDVKTRVSMTCGGAMSEIFGVPRVST
jgi:hypothetical protein